MSLDRPDSSKSTWNLKDSQNTARSQGPSIKPDSPDSSKSTQSSESTASSPRASAKKAAKTIREIDLEDIGHVQAESYKQNQNQNKHPKQQQKTQRNNLMK